MADEKQPIQTPYDTETEESFDAKVMQEEIQEGEVKAPPSHIEEDYDLSKQYNQGEYSHPDQEAQQKDKKVASMQAQQQSGTHTADAKQPGDFEGMAKEVNPQLKR